MRLALPATAVIIIATLASVGVARATPPEWRKSSDPQLRALAARLDWFERQFPHPGRVFLERNAGLHPMAGVVHPDHPNLVRARRARQKSKEVTFQPCGSRCRPPGAARSAPSRATPSAYGRNMPTGGPSILGQPAPRPTTIIRISPVITR